MLALDIGIKNLAYCIGTIEDDKVSIKHWSLVNLTDLNQTNQKPLCATCEKPAKASSPRGNVCGRHLKLWDQIYDEKTGKPITKQPTISQLQTFLKLKGLDTKGQRPLLFARASAVAAMPLIKKKSVASFADNTSRLHDAIREWITRDWSHLSTVKDVYIEHQPVLKNPVMKTVQILIFATLRERLIAIGQQTAFHFIHAGKKVKAQAGDAGYKDRKQGGEDRVKTFLEKYSPDSQQYRWFIWWQAQTKKDDLADTLCMLMDAC